MFAAASFDTELSAINSELSFAATVRHSHSSHITSFLGKNSLLFSALPLAALRLSIGKSLQ
jgi:hypothetical protein